MQRSVQLPLPDHEVNHNKRLEHHRPCCLSNSNMQRPEDLCYACFASTSRYKDILDIFRFRGRQLSQASASKTLDRRKGRIRGIQLTLTFVAPFTDFSKLDILSLSRLCYFEEFRLGRDGSGDNVSVGRERKGDAADSNNRGIKSILVRTQKASIVHASSFIGLWLRNEVIWLMRRLGGEETRVMVNKRGARHKRKRRMQIKRSTNLN